MTESNGAEWGSKNERGAWIVKGFHVEQPDFRKKAGEEFFILFFRKKNLSPKGGQKKLKKWLKTTKFSDAFILDSLYGCSINKKEGDSFEPPFLSIFC